MTEKTEILADNPIRKEKSVLTDVEIESGYKIIGPYIDDKSTPVQRYCFVRKGYIIKQAIDMSSKHNYLIFQLRMLIQKHLTSKGIKKAKDHIFTANRVNIKDTYAPLEKEEVLPDIAVFNEPIVGDIASIPPGKIPVLVIEVLSQSTALIDLTEKKKKYRERGVPNYWVLKKAEDPKEGLDSSYFFKLHGNKYFDISTEFQESGLLKCEELFGLALSATDIWFSEEQNDAVIKWHESELRAEQEKQRAEQEKQRAEQEKQRAEQEKQLRIYLTKKWNRYAELVSKGSQLTEVEKEEKQKLKKELQP